jgi:hypothetical protein
MDWQPSVEAKGKELKISLLEAAEFYVRRPAVAIAASLGGAHVEAGLAAKILQMFRGFAGKPAPTEPQVEPIAAKPNLQSPIILLLTRAFSKNQPTPRWRRASYSSTPAATETLMLSTRPAMGMATRKSHSSRVSRRSPFPSPPSTNASGPRKSVS